MNESITAAMLPSDVVEAFAAAAITTLRELVQIEASSDATAGPVAAPKENCIVATVRLLRPIPGDMSFVSSVESVAALAERYLPEGTMLTDELVNDVAGEFANVIAGQAKTALKQTPYHFRLSVPTVTRVASLADVPDVATATAIGPLTIESGRLMLLVDLSPCPGD